MSGTPRPRLVSVLVLSALTLILIGRSGGPQRAAIGGLRTVARSTFVPFESAGDAVFAPLESMRRGLGRAGDVARLESEVTRRREQVASEAARADGLAAENERLAALLGVDGSAGRAGTAARVVSAGGDRPGGALVIDRGGVAGIEVGMPVVAAGGLVGRVVEVGPRHSIVLPVTDPASAVGVRCEVAGEAPVAGVAQGRGGPALRLDLLDPSARLRDGAPAVTSGLRHSLFPEGLAVGRVAGSPGRFVVEPFAPPDRLELVKVLRWKPER